MSRSCPKLKELNLSGIKTENVECVEKLWEIMASMVYLRVLSIPLNLVSRKMDTRYPHLTALELQQRSHSSEQDVQDRLDFVGQIACLQEFQLDVEGPVFLSKFLHSCRLTHFYVTGDGVALPTDPSCYANMKQIVIADPHHLSLGEDLANALVKSKKLNFLGVSVHSCDLKAVTILASSRAIQMLNIYTVSLSAGYRLPLVDLATELGSISDCKLALGAIDFYDLLYFTKVIDII